MANNIPSSTADAQSTIVSRLRFPLILLVVYVHSFGIPAEDTNVPLLHSGFYEMVRTLLSGMIAHSAVPTFFFISGFLMFYRVEGYSLQLYRTKMRNRFFSLLIPYIIWNLIALGVWFVRQIDMGLAADEVVSHYMEKGIFSCFWIFYMIGGGSVDWFGNVSHLTAPIDLPLWFLRDLIVVSICSPVVYFVIRRGRGWALSFLAVLFLSGLFQNCPGLSSCCVFFYSFGAWFSITKRDFATFFHRFFQPALWLYVLLLGIMVWRHGTEAASMLFPLLRLIGMFVFLGFAEWGVRHTSSSLPSVFAEGSFFVFAVHYVIFLSFVDQLVGTVLPTTHEVTHALQYLVTPLIKTCLYIAVYYLLKRWMPQVTSILVGKR